MLQKCKNKLMLGKQQSNELKNSIVEPCECQYGFARLFFYKQKGDLQLKTLRIGLIGAGERGANSYAPYALKFPHEMKFVAVAEPRADRRAAFASNHGIADEMCFDDWRGLLASKPDLDGILIATQDKQHYEPTMAALEAGYHILLEKPIAETIEKTTEMINKAKEKNRLLMVCHVLRYTDFYLEIKKIIDSGKLGKIMSLDQVENIGNWHYSHSYVRGNWRKSADSSPMIVAKASHDLDILNFLVGSKCTRLNSFGSLSYFKKENCPENAAERCTACLYNKECNFSAYRYLTDWPNMNVFKGIVMRTDDNDAFVKNLETSPYGRCVYQCDNDVCDHQVVSMEYENGTTATLSVSAFTKDTKRQLKVMGTLAELEGSMEEDYFEIKHFGSGKVERHNLQVPKTMHAGGDERIMSHFAQAIRNPSDQKYSAEFSLMGHAMAFAAEESRVCGGKLVTF